LSGADPLVCAGPPGPACRCAQKTPPAARAGQGVGRRRGRPPHIVALLLLALILPGCKHRKVAERQTVEEPTAASIPSMASTIDMGDAQATPQLVSGFYAIESNSWRWTMRQFSVDLRPPMGAASKGAALVLKLTLPEPVLQAHPSLTLSVSVNGNKLAPQTWSKAGSFVYQRDLPAAWMTGSSVRVDFELDKALPPSEKDARELGVVVSKVGLELR